MAKIRPRFRVMWVCSKCYIQIESPTQPRNSNCPADGNHMWKPTRF